MAAGSIFAGMFKEPYDIKDTHSRTGVVISLIVAFVIIIAISNPFKGLIYSQMALSIQLPVTVFTQVYLTSSEKVMGKFQQFDLHEIPALYDRSHRHRVEPDVALELPVTHGAS